MPERQDPGSHKGQPVAYSMTRQERGTVRQPKPSTVGITKRMVREHAARLYRDKTPNSLSLKDWITAEKDLVQIMEAELA
jgi:hypothetical protein